MVAAVPVPKNVQDVVDTYEKLTPDEKKLFAQAAPQTLEDDIVTRVAAVNAARLTLQPAQGVVNFAWKVIISVFAGVFVLSALGIIASVFWPHTGDLLITIFSTSVGFLAGVLSPSPVGSSGPPGSNP